MGAAPFHNSDAVIHIPVHMRIAVSYATLCAFPHHPQRLWRGRLDPSSDDEPPPAVDL